jgi:uncharacterized membrane protein
MFDSLMHWLGFGLCHQLASRSFVAGGHQLPVCARDTGIYLGFVVSFAVIALLDRGRRRTEVPPAWVLGVGAAFVLVMLWDGITSYAGLRDTTNLIRLVTGVGTGFALTLIVVPILNQQLWKRRGSGRVLEGPLEGIAWLLAAPLTVAAAWWVGPMLGAGYAAVTAVAVLATFSAVNLIIIALVPRFEQRAARMRDAWPALALSLAATVVELALADWLRLALLSLLTRR